MEAWPESQKGSPTDPGDSDSNSNHQPYVSSYQRQKQRHHHQAEEEAPYQRKQVFQNENEEAP